MPRLSRVATQTTAIAVIICVFGTLFGSFVQPVQAAVVSETPEAVVSLNGDATAIFEASDNSIYLGGGFSEVGGHTTEGLAKLNADGSVDTNWAFNMDFGSVNSIAEAPDGKIYVGGSFEIINGVARTNIARVNTDGTVDTSFSANTNGTVRDIEVDGDGNVYIGGDFTTVGGVTNRGVAKLNSSGAVQWSLSTFTSTLGNGIVYALEYDSADGSVVFGGFFNNVNGTAATGLAKLNNSGTVQSYPDVTGPAYAVNALAMAADGSVYVGGYFTSIEGVSRQSLARITSADVVDEDWQVDPNDDSVYALALDADENLYVGGNFETLSGNAVSQLGFISAAGTLNTSWAPTPDQAISVFMVAEDGTLYVAGAFTTIGEESISYIAKFAPDAGGGGGGGGSSNQVRFMPSPRMNVDLEHAVPGSLRSGDQVVVTWFAFQTLQLPYVDLEWSIDGGETWLPIARETMWRSRHSWIVPDVEVAVPAARIRATLSDGLVADLGGVTRPFSVYPREEADESK